MKERRWFKRVVLASAAALTLTCAGLLAWGAARPAWHSRGGFAAGVSGGRVELAWSSGAIARGPIAWDLRGTEGSASILVGPASWWRPSASSASIGISPGAPAAPLFTLTVVYVPLWPWLLLSGGLTGGLWWRWRRAVLPGHCRACGYDLRGLPAGRCPECGREPTLLRIVRRLSATVGPRAREPVTG